MGVSRMCSGVSWIYISDNLSNFRFRLPIGGNNILVFHEYVRMSANFSSGTVWTGDNHEIMRRMNSECVDLIYLEPPFNSNRTYEAPIGSKAAGASFTQISAWLLAHRLREAFAPDTRRFLGPVEVDETYIGGKDSNRHAHKKTGTSTGGKAIVTGAMDRGARKIQVRMVVGTDRLTLKAFVMEVADESVSVYCDGHHSYHTLPHKHESVNHSAGDFLRGVAHTNGIESFWSMLKRSCHGTFHHFSMKHLQRYVNEFTARYNVRKMDTI